MHLSSYTILLAGSLLCLSKGLLLFNRTAFVDDVTSHEGRPRCMYEVIFKRPYKKC